MAEERLWAPWRLEYIRGPKAEECIFCRAVESDEDESNFVVHRGELAFVMLNAYPYNNGHVMVAPYAHEPAIDALDDATTLEMMQLVKRSMAALREVYRPEGFNIGINQGAAAGAGIEEHVHQHVVPRWGGDTNFMPVIGDVRVLPQSLSDSWKELRSVF
ncbi:MAG: adenylyltransferase [Thermoleophilaceae bacterium]|nr:adenylyltransferase [Thermoleophilaceae bacterium]